MSKKAIQINKLRQKRALTAKIPETQESGWGRLEKLRSDLKMTQKEFCKRAGLSVKTYEAWKRAEDPPRIVIEFAKLLIQSETLQRHIQAEVKQAISRAFK